jgi:hypothetical protein
MKKTLSLFKILINYIKRIWIHLDIVGQMVICMFLFFGGMCFAAYITVLQDTSHYSAFPTLEKVIDAQGNNILITVFKWGISHIDTNAPYRKLVSFDNGVTWQPMSSVSNSAMILYPFGFNQEGGFLSNGSALAISTMYNGTYYSNEFVARSTDNTATWLSNTPLNSSYIYDWLPSSPPVENTPGHVLMAAYNLSDTVANRIDATLFHSSDFGNSIDGELLFCTGVQNGIGCNEPNIGLLSNGTMLALIRDNGTTGSDNNIRESYSYDKGATWTNISIANLPIAFSGNGLPSWIQLSSGTCVATTRDATSSAADLFYSTTCSGTWTLWGTIDSDMPYANMMYAGLQEVSKSPEKFGIIVSEQANTSQAYLYYKTFEETTPGSITVINTVSTPPVFTNTINQAVPSSDLWTGGMSNFGLELTNSPLNVGIGVQLTKNYTEPLSTEPSLVYVAINSTGTGGTAQFVPNTGVVLNSVATTDAAVTYVTQPFTAISNGVLSGKISYIVTGSLSNTTGTNTISLWENNPVQPGLWNSSTQDYRVTYDNFGGPFYIYYYNGATAYDCFDVNLAWQSGCASGAWTNAVSPNFTRTLQIDVDNTQGVRFALYNGPSTSSPLIVQTPWDVEPITSGILFEHNLGQNVNSLSLVIGDPFNNVWSLNGNETITNIGILNGPYPTSPVYADTGFFPVIGSHIYYLNLAENPIAYSNQNIAGIENYDLAYNNGALQGLNLTGTDLQLKLRSLNITDHVNSLRIKSTLNSINNYPADVSLMSFTTDKPSISNAVSIGFFNPPMTGGMR